MRPPKEGNRMSDRVAYGRQESSKCPRFELIPRAAYLALVRRAEKGVEAYKEKNWSAISDDQSALDNRAFAIARCTHIIEHALRLMEALIKGGPWEPDEDPAAIMWGGMFLHSYVMRRVEGAL